MTETHKSKQDAFISFSSSRRMTLCKNSTRKKSLGTFSEYDTIPLIDKPADSPSLPPLSAILPSAPEYGQAPYATAVSATTISMLNRRVSSHQEDCAVPTPVSQVKFNSGYHDTFFVHSKKKNYTLSGSSHATYPKIDKTSKKINDATSLRNYHPISKSNSPSQPDLLRQHHVDRIFCPVVPNVAGRVRKRSEEPVKGCLACSATETPEWRKGPTGPRTLCNACGLFFAKQVSLFPFAADED